MPDPTDSKKFLLISPPRSASTSIRKFLDALDKVLCHGEIFGANKVLGTSDKFKREFGIHRRRFYPDKFYSTYFPRKWEFEGFKALTSHLLIPDNFVLLDRYLSENPKIFIVWRNNIVDQSISLIMHKVGLGLIDKQFDYFASSDFIEKQIMTTLSEMRKVISAYNFKSCDFDVISPDKLSPLNDYFDLSIEMNDLPRIQGDIKINMNEYQSKKDVLLEITRSNRFDIYRDISIQQLLRSRTAKLDAQLSKRCRQIISRIKGVGDK